MGENNVELEAINEIEDFLKDFIIKHIHFNLKISNIDISTFHHVHHLLIDLIGRKEKFGIYLTSFIAVMMINQPIISKLDIAILKCFLIELQDIKEHYIRKNNVSKSQN